MFQLGMMYKRGRIGGGDVSIVDFWIHLSAKHKYPHVIRYEKLFGSTQLDEQE